MSTEATRASPVLGRLQALGARFVEVNAMAVAASIDEADAARAGIVGIADLSCLRKTGFKGSKSADWAREQGIALPPVNGWAQAGDNSLVVRLGDSEFFIEDSPQTALCARVIPALKHCAEGVYPVHRNDAGFALVGDRVNDLMVETCSFEFRKVGGGNAVMTTMAGVTVLVIRRDVDARLCYRIWCDPTMAAYLWDTLNEIALDLGGGPVGSDIVLAASPPA
jgi:sarcosine oxidase subunit gamma